MGFFSQDCKRCGHPALSIYAVNEINDWMMHVVAIQPNGDLHIGTYDGYGRIGAADEVIGFDATVWHRACWELEGKPMKYQGASEPSADQGYFFHNEHDTPDPRKVN